MEIEMSKIPYNSYPVPRELEQSEYFKTAKPLWKLVMYCLLSHAVYKEELPYDLHGSIVMLKRGQVAFTLRQIAYDLGIHKNDVERAILHFTGFNTKREMGGLLAAGRQPILVRQETGQKSRQEKTVLSIVWNGYCNNSETISETISETGGETRKRQERDINKKDKKEKKEDKNNKSPNGDNNHPPGDEPTSSLVGAITRRFFFLDSESKSFDFTEKEIHGWEEYYKNINPRDHFHEMALWLLKHKDEKFRRQIPRKFITEWLAKNDLKPKKRKTNHESNTYSEFKPKNHIRV